MGGYVQENEIQNSGPVFLRQFAGGFYDWMMVRGVLTRWDAMPEDML